MLPLSFFLYQYLLEENFSSHLNLRNPQLPIQQRKNSYSPFHLQTSSPSSKQSLHTQQNPIPNEGTIMDPAPTSTSSLPPPSSCLPTLASPPTFYLNLHTASPSASQTFYTAIGFTPVPEYTDEATRSFRLPAPNNAICLMIHDAQKRFKEFIRPGTDTNDAKKTTEALFSIAVNEKEKVDEMLRKAEEAGGEKDPFVMEGYGQGMSMYSRSFADVDGHIWEAVFSLPVPAKAGEEKKGE